MTPEEFFGLVQSRRGHFRYESGLHSDVWLDLETLFSRPERVRPHLSGLARECADLCPEVVCGGLIEGAFVALALSEELRSSFAYTVRIDVGNGTTGGVRYELPKTLIPVVRSRRVLIANDVISAGSAVRGTFSSLQQAGADVVGIASIAVLGDAFARFAAENKLRVASLLQFSNNLWTPAECPLCRIGSPAESLATH